MFTVKLVEQNGHEQIHEAGQVWAEPAKEPGYHQVYITPPLPPEEPVCFGGPGARLFVMNDKGQTVARYLLGTRQTPHGPGCVCAACVPDRAGG